LATIVNSKLLGAVIMNTLTKSLLTTITFALLGLTNSYALESKGVVVTEKNFIHADSTRAYLKKSSHPHRKPTIKKWQKKRLRPKP